MVSCLILAFNKVNILITNLKIFYLNIFLLVGTNSQIAQVRWEKKQVYGRRDGGATVGHTVVFCALWLHRKFSFFGLRPTDGANKRKGFNNTSRKYLKQM
jgi:hypothetical protein